MPRTTRGTSLGLPPSCAGWLCITETLRRRRRGKRCWPLCCRQLLWATRGTAGSCTDGLPAATASVPTAAAASTATVAAAATAAAATVCAAIAGAAAAARAGAAAVSLAGPTGDRLAGTSSASGERATSERRVRQSPSPTRRRMRRRSGSCRSGHRRVLSSGAQAAVPEGGGLGGRRGRSQGCSSSGLVRSGLGQRRRGTTFGRRQSRQSWGAARTSS